MKIAMVHDCAYVGYELKRGLTQRGVEVQHLFFSGPSKIAALTMALKLKRVKCDLIHAHFCRSPAYAAYLSGRPYVIHSHGTDIRWGLNWLQRRCLRKAERALVSTPDLLEILPHAMWLPNPVDTDRFRPLKEHRGNRVLYFPHWYEDLTGRVRETCRRLGYDTTVPRFMSLPYESFHLFLNEFDVFIDRFSVKSYSKTALEALACRIPVISYKDRLEESLEKLTSIHERRKLVEWQNEHILPWHRLEAVVDKLIQLYNELL